MKRGWLTLLLVMAVMGSSKAQTFSEWFSQKKTQKKYLLQQIAALQVYISYAREGYDLTRKGLGVISDIKNGDFNLHSAFFNSLSAVSPAVRRYSRIAATVDLQLSMLKTCRRDMDKIRQAGLSKTGELEYLDKVYGRLLSDCEHIIEELLMVTTSGELELKDDERLQRIDKLFTQMQENYSFCAAFGSQAKVMMLQRQRELDDGKKVRRLYGMENN